MHGGFPAGLNGQGLSIISMAAGNIPAAIMPLTAAPAFVGSRKTLASNVRMHSGRFTIRRVTFVAMPSVPSEPTKTAHKGRIPGMFQAFFLSRRDAPANHREAQPRGPKNVRRSENRTSGNAPPAGIFPRRCRQCCKTDCDEGSGA